MAESLKKAFSQYSSTKKLTYIMTKIRKQKKENNDNLRGFLMGLAFGAIIYGFLSLFEKPRCPNCDAKQTEYIQNLPMVQQMVNSFQVGSSSTGASSSGGPVQNVAAANSGKLQWTGYRNL